MTEETMHEEPSREQQDRELLEDAANGMSHFGPEGVQEMLQVLARAVLRTYT